MLVLFGTSATSTAFDGSVVDDPRNSSQSYRYLTLGNSHSSVGDPFKHLESMISGRDSQFKVMYKSLSAAFIDQFSDIPQLKKVAKELNARFVSIQGQKISSSGKFFYSTREAEEIASALANDGFRVLLFAEWGRLGNREETKRIQKTYEDIREHVIESIKGEGTIEVVPVGVVWDRVLDEFPTKTLHDRDGNHSNVLGAIVTAITFYVWLFDEEPKSTTLDKTHRLYLQKVAKIALETCREIKSSKLKHPK